MPDRDCLGVYYDDPDAVDPPDLRYAVGAIIADADAKDEDRDEERENKDAQTMLSQG